MDFSQDLVKGSIVPVILALLRERPMYGYEMVKLVNARTGGTLEWREGTLYPALHRLAADGLLKSAWRDVTDEPDVPPTGGPRKRKYYSITPAGRRELDRRAAEWREFSGAIDRLLNAEGGGR